jgi:hypothetical protein
MNQLSRILLAIFLIVSCSMAQAVTLGETIIGESEDPVFTFTNSQLSMGFDPINDTQWLVDATSTAQGFYFEGVSLSGWTDLGSGIFQSGITSGTFTWRDGTNGPTLLTGVNTAGEVVFNSNTGIATGNLTTVLSGEKLYSFDPNSGTIEFRIDGLLFSQNPGTVGFEANSEVGGFARVSAQPVPEPATITLMAAGLVGALIRRKKANI